MKHVIYLFASLFAVSTMLCNVVNAQTNEVELAFGNQIAAAQPYDTKGNPISVAVIYNPVDSKFYYVNTSGTEVDLNTFGYLPFSIPRDSKGNPLTVLATYNPTTGKFYYMTSLGGGGTGGLDGFLTEASILYAVNDSTVGNTPFIYLAGVGIGMQGYTITGLKDAVNDSDAVNKSQLDVVDTKVDNHIADLADPHDIRLNQIGNPTANGSINMNAYTQAFTFSNPAGGIAYNWIGAASGHLFELSQIIGNPTTTTHLLHIDADDVDVTNIHSQHANASAVNMKIEGGKVVYVPIEGATITVTDSGLVFGQPASMTGAHIYGGLYLEGNVNAYNFVNRQFSATDAADTNHVYAFDINGNLVEYWDDAGSGGGGIPIDSTAFARFGDGVVQPRISTDNLNMLDGALYVDNNVARLDSILNNIIVVDTLGWIQADSTKWRVKKIELPSMHPYDGYEREGVLIIEVRGRTFEYMTFYSDSLNGVTIENIFCETHGYDAGLDGGRIVSDLSWVGNRVTQGTLSSVTIGGYKYGNRRVWTNGAPEMLDNGDSHYRFPVVVSNVETSSGTEFEATFKVKFTVSAGNYSTFWVGLTNN